MTKAVRNRILKDANGHISDHLRNHIHLTNCIHLKNHMHKQSPMLTDSLLMRDLIVLQRSRSLRDPSASPPSWHSPSVVDLLPKKSDKDSTFLEGRRSVGIERRRESRRLSGGSPPFSLAPSKVVPGELGGGNDGVAAIMSDHSSRSGARDNRRNKREESTRKSNRANLSGSDEDHLQGQDVNSLMNDAVLRNSESKSRKTKQKGKHSRDTHIKTLSEQLNEVALDSDVDSSNIHQHGQHSQQENNGEEPEASIRGYTAPKRVKRQKFRGARRNRNVSSSRDVGAQNEMSLASNSLAQASERTRYHMDDEEEEFGEQTVVRIPKNGCGIPFNWSRIHHRGKTFLDMAGRSLSCGLSDTRLRRSGIGSHERDGQNMPVASDYSSSSAKSVAEALPLLVDASGSLESTDNAGWVHDYSGELGLYADHLLKNDVDSDLVSEARSGGQPKRGRHQNSRHQNLTQKYMPKTFRDLVGQNLVVQALSNAIMRRKIGLLYVFYGPRGTGKTSCARIFARALNCQSLEHPKPCGYCSSCLAHDMGNNRNVREVGPVSSFDFESIMDLLDNMIISHPPSQYRVFIFDDCDTLSVDCWSAMTKLIDRAPSRVVFVLVSLSLDVLPHIIMSRCQKFFFPKLKDADIIYTLQRIASKEGIDIDKDALKLIASRSDGSLRDAEMTLEQLSLLGLKISVPLVQELVGLISDEKLVDLLDLALSADTVNTVKNLRAIMETGVEPLVLMSQLAAVITDVLAGSYDFRKERKRRNFFRKQPLSKEDMEKLRQALKTLSEAEKQLRTSSDKLTWLTAALLQLAPDQQYLLPSSSTETSFNQSPVTQNNRNGRGITKEGTESARMANNDRDLSAQIMLEDIPGTSGDFHVNDASNYIHTDKKQNDGAGRAHQRASALSSDIAGGNVRQIAGKSRQGYEEIWLEVLGKIQFNSLSEFLYREGKLISVSFGSATTVQLLFSSHFTKSKAEKFMAHILQAFESVLRSPVKIEIRCESGGLHAPLVLPPSKSASLQMAAEPESGSRMQRAGESLDVKRSEIVEIPVSLREIKGNEDSNSESSKRGVLLRESLGESVVSRKKSGKGTLSERRKVGELSQSKSIVRSKVSLAHVLQQAEGCAQQRPKAVSIAEKLEQENLRLEPRSRSFLCWKASRVTRRKRSRLKLRSRRPHSLLKLVSCGKCLSSKSPR